ncbi:MAG: hypothetical protein JXR19_09585 [Bacteroidia bacterium]
MSFQQTFIDILKSKIPSHISLVDEIAELLVVSKDSAYRRLRGDTPLTLDEAVKISLHFDISPAALLEQATDLIPFKFNKLYGENNGFLQYIQQMTAVIKQVTAVGGHIIYAAEDIPVFRNFRYKNLTAFKVFYWSKSVLDSEGFKGKKFSKNMVHPDIFAAAEELNKAYSDVKSTEIWAEETVNSTIRQIEYYASSFQFESKDEAFLVLEDLSLLVKELEEQAENGNKSSNPHTQNFKLHDSEVLIGNNSIIVEGLDKPIVFLGYNTFNSVSTRDYGFHAETEKWMNNLIKRSTLISGVSEKQRFHFFKRLNGAISKCRERIDKQEY